MSPGSVTSGSADAASPLTRRMFSLSLTGWFGLDPLLNGGFHHVL
jgi:hypothetical protein